MWSNATDIFAAPAVLAQGALVGLIFGILLQKGGVTRFRVIVDQMLLRDFTVLKIMFTAMTVGGIGIYGAIALGLEVPLHVKASALVATGLGGLIFGVGMAVLGYCPGTAVAALGDGSRHAGAGVLGMLVGAGLYAEVQPHLGRLLGAADFGKVTFADITGLSVWWFLAVLVLAVLVLGGVTFPRKTA